jgi:hypothetical protein
LLALQIGPEKETQQIPEQKPLVHWRKDSLSGEWKFRREFLMLSEQNFSFEK